jgi:hypothetical protein
MFFILVFCCNNLFAQTAIQEPSQSPYEIYRLFRTTNMWTFIKLNTITGKMWQVQFGNSSDKRFTNVLNSKDLAGEKEYTPGRFTLYPTQNMWTFILVDQIDGDMWQIQWGFDKKDRLVLPID